MAFLFVPLTVKATIRTHSFSKLHVSSKRRRCRHGSRVWSSSVVHGTETNSGIESSKKLMERGAFTEWAKQSGISWKKLDLVTFLSFSKGFRANGSIKKGEALLSVPATSVLQVNTLDVRSSPLPSLISSETWKKMPWYARLALVLLSKKDSESEYWQQWIEMLPSTFDHPLHWSEQELGELQSLRLSGAVHSQRKVYRKLFNYLSENTQNAIAKHLNYTSFVWAIDCVRSRSFAGPLEPAPFKKRLRLGLFIGANVVIWPLLRLLDWNNAINGGLTALFALATYDFLLPKILRAVRSIEMRRYALAPGIDFFNHSFELGVQANVSYEYFSDRFVVRSGADYNSGDHVYVHYGAQNNDSLLQFYGFVEDGNPNDDYVFDDKTSKGLGIAPGCLRARKDIGFEDSVVQKMVKAFGGDKQKACSALSDLCISELRNFPTTIKQDEQLLDSGRVEMGKRRELAVRYRLGKKQILFATSERMRELAKG